MLGFVMAELRLHSAIFSTPYIRMSENYLGSDGFRPLVLPERGEDLLEGRQYALTPLFRLILKEEYGLVNVPTIVECFHKKIPATLLETRSTNLETGEVRESKMELPAQSACFRAFLGHGRILKFEVELLKLDEMAPFYDPSHQLPGQKKEYLDREIEKMERDWFAQSSLQPIHRKFRGCTLRWWSKGAPTKEGTFILRKKRRCTVDTSLLDD